MKRSRVLGTVCACTFNFISLLPHAALVDNGSGLIYDDVLNITWAQPDTMTRTWNDANTWVLGLTLGGVGGWRLPYISVAAGAGSFGLPVECSTASELACRDNELGYMFYHNLGGILGRSILTSGDADLALFPTLQSSSYWSGTVYGTSEAWPFYLNYGLQDLLPKNYSLYSWAVHAGNVGRLVDLNGTIKTIEGLDICAMVLASGKFIFACTPNGVFSLTSLPVESDGTLKRQIYADGFFPRIDVQPDSSTDAVVMKRSGTCPSYNTSYDQSFVPGSVGKRIYITGKILLQDSQTPICALVLANGQHMFSCDGAGSYALNIPLDSNGQFKVQVYADGFAPTIQIFDEFHTINNVRMARASECQ